MTQEPAKPVMVLVDCPECNGDGCGPTQPECCGNPYPSGECRSHCAVPVQQPCDFCGGQGQVEIDERELLRGSEKTEET